jgi:hypothetical protein
VHLRQLELGLDAYTAGERGVADHVTESLAVATDGAKSEIYHIH